MTLKKRYSAFFGTDLEARLSTIRPEALVIAGVNTHACVRMTVIDAYQRDYDVIVVADCVASSDPEHHAVTLLSRWQHCPSAPECGRCRCCWSGYCLTKEHRNVAAASQLRVL